MAVVDWQGKFHEWLGNGPVEKDLSPYVSLLRAVEAAGPGLAEASVATLKEHAEALRREIRVEGIVDSVIIEGFALVREVAQRTLGIRPYDVQMIAGMAMLQGKLVDMKTGEGKTLAAVLPASLEAMRGRGVHILTFNDYLAGRDAEWMGPVYAFLGLSVGAIQDGMSVIRRQVAYRSDVTYATAKQAGFDFLRMNLVHHYEEIVHRPFHYAIIDEADSILIDEARVPLVIAGPHESSAVDPYRIAKVVTQLAGGEHWETDEHNRNVLLTDGGIDFIEQVFNCGDLHADRNYRLLTEINQALHARVLLHKDVDYIVRGDVIELVDEFTGRVIADRRWPDGLQAAIEAKEGIEIQEGGKILGSVALHHFLRQYPKLAGMTGTAIASADEFEALYGLKVAPIPTNKPNIRIDRPTRIYTHDGARHAALITEIRNAHRAGRPVLVGTGSIMESERLAASLEKEEIACSVLNAKNDQLEAEIVADAGAPGAVTISTNMAGRGTDIKLGGADEAARDAVVARGGLLVIGTTMHESRRIDDQLRGRAGRQGDPGESMFLVSLEDTLIRRFGIHELIPGKFWPENQAAPIDHPFIRREVARIQRIVEGQNYEIRKTLRRYSELVETQREQVHVWRMGMLEGGEATEMCRAIDEQHYLKLAGYFGMERLSEALKEVVLFHIDACWSDHLALIAELREGIHLVGIGGLNPLHEFHKNLIEAYSSLQNEIERRVTDTFRKLQPVEGRLDLVRAGLERPSSTWTYLINDRVMSDLQNMLFGQGSSAFAALAVVATWPLLLVWGIWKRWKLRE